MLLLIAAVAAAPISLSTVTGGMIADECSHSEGLKLDVCASYVLGVADTLQLEHKTCRPPSEAATLQTLTIARRYLSNHPEKWGGHPSFLIRVALVQAFPCRTR